MKWNPAMTSHLYELYIEYIGRLHCEVTAANARIGTTATERTRLKPLTRVEFEAVLKSPREPIAVSQWIKRIIRGREHEFPAFVDELRRQLSATGS